MSSNKNKVESLTTLSQKIREYFKLQYEYWWDDYPNAWTKIRDLGPPTFQEKWRDFKYKLSEKYRIKKWEFKESFKWHVKCYLMFWRLPKLLQHSLDGFYASESMQAEEAKEHHDYRTLVYALMDDQIADRIWCNHLTKLNKEEADLTDSERSEIYQDIKDEYEVRQLECPDKYLTEDEQWDRAEVGYEQGRLGWPGGPNYDDRPKVVYVAKDILKKYKIESRYLGDWGQ